MLFRKFDLFAQQFDLKISVIAVVMIIKSDLANRYDFIRACKQFSKNFNIIIGERVAAFGMKADRRIKIFIFVRRFYAELSGFFIRAGMYEQ